MTCRGLTGLLLALAIGGGSPVQAQTSFAPAVEPDRWQDLSPDTRSQMRQQYLESLPQTKREKLHSQVKRFNSMSSSQKQELCRRFEKDRGYLPPACQKLF